MAMSCKYDDKLLIARGQLIGLIAIIVVAVPVLRVMQLVIQALTVVFIIIVDWLL